jgi:hypothetical protein
MSNQPLFRVISRKGHLALAAIGLRRPRAAIHPLAVLATGAIVGVGVGLAIPPQVRGRISRVVRQGWSLALLGPSTSSQPLPESALADDAEGAGNEGKGSRTAEFRKAEEDAKHNGFS